MQGRGFPGAQAILRLAAVLGDPGAHGECRVLSQRFFLRGDSPGVETMPSAVCGEGRQSVERSGLPRGGCHLSVSVSCRTRSRRPTPSRPAPGRRVKGKISRQGGVVRRCQLYSAPVFGKNMVQTPGQALFVENKAVFNASCCFCLRKKALFQRVVGPRFAKEGRVSTLWGPRPAFRRPGRWMQAAAIHSRR